VRGKVFIKSIKAKRRSQGFTIPEIVLEKSLEMENIKTRMA